MHWAGFEPASLATVELKSTPLNHSGTNASFISYYFFYFQFFLFYIKNIILLFIIMTNSTAYGILVFYGILAIVCAALGEYLDKANGFTTGYIVGVVISVTLWFAVGKKAAGM